MCRQKVKYFVKIRTHKYIYYTIVLTPNNAARTHTQKKKKAQKDARIYIYALIQLFLWQALNKSFINIYFVIIIMPLYQPTLPC